VATDCIVEPAARAPAAIVACAVLVTAWGGAFAAIPVAPRGNVAAGHFARSAVAPEQSPLGVDRSEAVSARLEIEAAWMLDPQLCLDAILWLRAGAWARLGEVGIVKCWR